MKKRKPETVTLSLTAYGAIERALILAINEAYAIEDAYDKCYEEQYESQMWAALNALQSAKAGTTDDARALLAGKEGDDEAK